VRVAVAPRAVALVRAARRAVVARINTRGTARALAPALTPPLAAPPPRRRGSPPMASHGAAETAKLKSNIQDQLNRLLQQLQDLEDLRDELDDEEYAETRRDTLEQMEVRARARGVCGGGGGWRRARAAVFPRRARVRHDWGCGGGGGLRARARSPPAYPPARQEFDGQLRRFMDGDMTLVSELGQMKIALRAAISSGFCTTDVIKSFAAREPGALRARLARLAQDLKLGRLAPAPHARAALEVVFALQKLGEELTAEEKTVLDSASAAQRRAFQAATEGGAVGEAAVKALAGQGARAAAR
jgi:hypothetical protein